MADIRYLKKKWASIQSATQAAGKVPRLLHEELPLALRACRDLIQQDTEVVRIDSSETFQAAKAFCEVAEPEVLNKLQWYPGERPCLTCIRSKKKSGGAGAPRGSEEWRLSDR